MQYLPFIIKLCFIENAHAVSSDEYMNVTMTADDGGYYNTTELNTFIQIADLQRVIQEKGTGENNVFQSEYKVYISLLLSAEITALNGQVVCTPCSRNI